MANVRSGNTWYVDTASESLSARNVSLVGVIMSANGGGATLVLADDSSGGGYPTKLELLQIVSTSTHHDFSAAPIVFPNGIRVVTATNTHATLIIRTPGETS